MVSSPFSLGNEFLAESTDTYLREKFAKAKGKAKAKVPKRSGGNRGNDSLGAPGRSIGPQQQEDLDEAERDLLGLPKAPPRAKSPRPEMELLPLEAGAALRLAASGASVSSKRCCPDGHQLFCYIVARSAALCDTCDTMQKPGEVVFGCSTCDSELCAKCAVETASSTEEADESRELIARVTQMYSGEKCTRFVATPSGAVLDTLDTHQQPELRDKGPEEKLESSTQASDKKENREAAKPPQLPARRKLASELDESTWKGQWGYPLPNDQTNALDKHRDMLGAILEEQERLIQARHLDHREVNEKYVSKGSQSYVAANPDAGAKDTNLMDENAAKMRPSWAVDGTEPKDATAGVPLERTFDLTLTLTGDFVDELARGYSQPWFQELLKLCSEECGEDRERFICRLQDIAFEVQRPILENWGFEGNEQGLFDMTSILREHSRTAPNWLQEKIDRCLLLLYGGPDGILGREFAAMAQREKSLLQLLEKVMSKPLGVEDSSTHLIDTESISRHFLRRWFRATTF